MKPHKLNLSLQQNILNPSYEHPLQWTRFLILCAPLAVLVFFSLYFPRVHGSLWVKLLSEPITICMDWIGSNPCIFNQIRTQPNGFELGQVDSNLFLNWNSPPIPNQLGICRVGSEGKNILGRFGFHELSANTPYLFCFYFYFML